MTSRPGSWPGLLLNSVSFVRLHQIKAIRMRQLHFGVKKVRTL